MGWRKLILGEKMPDKNDPKYKDRYEKEVGAGRKVARFLRIDKAAAWLQLTASKWPKLFLTIVFGIVIFCFVLNVYRLVTVANTASEYKTATERQEQLYKTIKQQHHDRSEKN